MNTASPSLPIDAIEATAARIRYGLDGSTYRRIAELLPTWRVGNAVYHSERALRARIRALAEFEPAKARG